MSNSTDKIGCISHRANSRFFIMFEDFLEIAGKVSYEHRHKLAAFWRVLETKTNDRITSNEERMKEAEKQGLPKPETNLWVEIAYSECVTRSLETYKSSSFQVAAAESERLGFSKSKQRKRPINPLDPQSPLEDYKEYLFLSDVMQSVINGGEYPTPIEINSPLLKALSKKKEEREQKRAIKNNTPPIEINSPPVNNNSTPLLNLTPGAIKNNRKKDKEESLKDSKDNKEESTGEQPEPTPFAPSLPFGAAPSPCFFCDKPMTGFCIECEKPVCSEHGTHYYGDMTWCDLCLDVVDIIDALSPSLPQSETDNHSQQGDTHAYPLPIVQPASRPDRGSAPASSGPVQIDSAGPADLPDVSLVVAAPEDGGVRTQTGTGPQGETEDIGGGTNNGERLDDPEATVPRMAAVTPSQQTSSFPTAVEPGQEVVGTLLPVAPVVGGQGEPPTHHFPQVGDMTVPVTQDQGTAVSLSPQSSPQVTTGNHRAVVVDRPVPVPSSEHGASFPEASHEQDRDAELSLPGIAVESPGQPLPPSPVEPGTPPPRTMKATVVSPETEGKAKPKRSRNKDEPTKQQIDTVYVVFDELYQAVLEDPEFTCPHTPTSTTAIKELIKRKASPGRLRQVFTDMWDDQDEDGTYWWRGRGRMTIKAVCNHYASRLATIQSRTKANLRLVPKVEPKLPPRMPTDAELRKMVY